MNPRLSVIIPVYNAEKYLQDCIQSVVEQTIFNEIEVIAVNDGSTDGSEKILRNFSCKYNNIRVINQKNQGIAIARQTGLKNTRGGYIAYLDDDDFINANMYEVMLREAEDNDADYIYCNYSFYPHSISTKAKWFKLYKGKVDWNLIERNTQPWNKLIRRDLVERIHMVDILPLYSDSVYVDLLLHARKIICLNKELYNYRVGHASVSGSYIDKLDYYLEVAERAKAQQIFIEDTPYKDKLQEYFEYRYIYALIQVCCVAAVNDNERTYKEAVHELKYMKYKKNAYTSAVLNSNYGKVKSFILVHIIPGNYRIARKICRDVFSKKE